MLVVVVVLVGVVVAVSRERERESAWSSPHQIQSIQPVAATTTTATAGNHALKAAVPFQQSHLCAVSKLI